MNKFILPSLMFIIFMAAASTSLADDRHHYRNDYITHYRTYDDRHVHNHDRHRHNYEHKHRRHYTSHEHRHYRAHRVHHYDSSNDYWKFVGGHILLNEMLYHGHVHDRYCRH